LAGALYSLFKDEVMVGHGDSNEDVIPHASISRAHALLMKRKSDYELLA